MRKSTLPSKKIALTFGMFWITIFGLAQSQSFTNPANNGLPANTFTVPTGVTSITVEAWGGGGRGGTRTTNGVGGGGGGGAYAKKVITVIPGNTYTVNVGAGSISTIDGGDSWFINNTTILAKGGKTVADNSATGGAGGLGLPTSIGDIAFSGGKGASGVSSSYGGGGGSSAGVSSVGVTATNVNGATAPSGGGNGGKGRNSSEGNGSPGVVPGGGGGGAYRVSSGTRIGGNGANGQVIITCNVPEVNITGNATSIINGDSTPSGTDWTDFGTTQIVSAPVTREFTIKNEGTATLNLTGTPLVAIAGSTDFSVIVMPSNSIASLNNTTFKVQFNPTSIGTKTATITIVNNDINENPYTFQIRGIGSQNFFDSDHDGVFDNIDIDDDNDGIRDVNEEINCENSNGHKVNYKFLNETFGTGTRTTINTTYDAITTYCYEDGIVDTNTTECPSLSDYSLNDGEYTVGSSAQIATWAATYWYKGIDHTPSDTNGRMAIFNASYPPGIFYTALITGAIPNIPVTYSFWVLNIDRTDAPSIATRLRPDVKVEFRDINDNVLTTISTGDIQPTTNGNLAGDWVQFTADLTFNVSTFKVIFINNETGGTGNDLALDDILITQTLCDLDNDGIADLFDLDADNDGVEDIIEAGLGHMSNGKGKMDVAWADSNVNGLHDSAESNPLLDSDNDGIFNYIDLDSDNDTLFDVDESNAGNSNAVSGFVNGDGDINGDGTGDGPESETFRSKDVNGDTVVEGFGDGILDIYDYGTGSTFNNQYGNLSQGVANLIHPAATYLLDSDNDGVPDYIDVTSNGSTFDIASTLYASLDANNDGKIDGSSDVDKDGITDAFDTNTAYFGSPRDLNRKLYLDFDGRNDYGQGTAILGGLTNASLMGWIDLNSTFSTTGVVVGQDKFQIRITNAKKLEAEVNGTIIAHNAVLNTAQWYHVAAVYGGGFIKLYLNGNLVVSQTANGNINADPSLLTIGRNPSSSNNYFKGKIDEVRVFNVALTDSQLQRMVYQEIQNFSSQVRGTVVPKNVGSLPYSNLLRYYRMDAYKDDIIDDLTTSGIDINTGMEIYNHKNIYVQQAPMPFVTEQAGNFQTAVNSPSKDIRGMDILDQDWSIVQVKHNITSVTNNTDLGMFVDPGVTIVMNNDTKIQNDWYLKLDGKIDLVGKSQLVQTTQSDLDISSAGFIERDQQGQSNKFNYNYWSSPVGAMNTSTNNNSYTVAGMMKDGTDPSNIQNIAWTSGYDSSASSPITLSTYWIFKFQNVTPLYANWASVGQNGSLLASQGFTLKGSNAATETQNYTFVGKPNSGVITTPIAANNLNLSGNPYPSAIDANAFISANLASTSGTLYFWEHYSTNYTHNLAEYQGGYATRNLVGGTPPVAPVEISGLGSSTRIPSRYIPVGQGFFIKGSTVGGNIVFDNSIRGFVKENHSDSNIMFKSITPANDDFSNNEDDIITSNNFPKLRLGFNSYNNYHRQILIGFMDENATSGIDAGYDALSIENLPNDIYFINDTSKLNIQGEGTFDYSNIYPLGVKCSATGNVQFVLDGLEDFDGLQHVYIYDNRTEKYYDIMNEPFEIKLHAGTFTERFSLRFQEENSNFGKNTDLVKGDSIIVGFTGDNSTIQIKNKILDTPVKSVLLYNMLGQIIATWDVTNQNQTEIKLPVKNLSVGTYIVKTQTIKGDISKKIIVN